MKHIGLVGLGSVLVAAAPAKDASPPPPIANYWMDVTTTSGMGAGMMGGGGRPSMTQIMGMMSGQSSVGHTLDLRLASRDKAAAPQADHLIPPGLQMGPSLPLIAREEPPHTPGMPANFQRPQGRMLVYWGCGEHVSAGQPTVLDFAKIAAGQTPPGLAAMAHVVSGPTGAPGFGRWPNDKDNRAVPAAGSLHAPHKIEANYAPPIAFSLGTGQDFMPALGLTEAGTLPSGASRLTWQAVPSATGYALMMFGAAANGDAIMWSSASKATMPAPDYLAPAEVRRLIGAGAVLPPATTQCVLPAEVAAASPAGMVTMIGYGPEAGFAESPKAPKWTARVRYKTTASVMRGMGAMMGGGAMGAAPDEQQQAQEPPKKKKKFGIGDLLNGAVPH